MVKWLVVEVDESSREYNSPDSFMTHDIKNVYIIQANTFQEARSKAEYMSPKTKPKAHLVYHTFAIVDTMSEDWSYFGGISNTEGK